MQVILKKPVRRLGKVGDIVNVKPGYGRNYLLPNDIALRASKDNIAHFESKKQELAAKNDENKKLAEATAKKLEGKNFIFVSQCAADGRLFGSVSHKAIALKLSEASDLPLNYSNVIMDDVIKFTGIHSVEIAYHPEVHSNVNIVVARSESEAQDIIVEATKEKSEKAAQAKKSETDSAAPAEDVSAK